MKTVLRGGTIIDGTGSASFTGDILLENDTILAVEPSIPISDEYVSVINVTEKTVTPGFVDMHRHCDIAPLTQSNFGQIELAQGITSTVVGHCGLAPLPFSPETKSEMHSFLLPIVGQIPENWQCNDYASYISLLRQANLSINMGFMAGMGAIKTAVKGFSSSPYTHEETKQARQWVINAMEAGALGVSLGIMYQPEIYSTKQEIMNVISPLSHYKGVLTTHIRGEGDSLVESVKEVIDIAKGAKVPLHISHLKATGKQNWHNNIYKAIACIENARKDGQDITADFYPYDAGSSTLQSLLPPSIVGQNQKEMLQMLATTTGKQFLKQELYGSIDGWDNMATSIGWERILISSVTLSEHKSYCGQSIALLAQQMGYGDSCDFVADLLVKEQGQVGIIVCSMAQEDVDVIAKLPWTSVISDALYGCGSHPHPRLYGAFSKVIREYVQGRNVLSLTQGIHKMTQMPAQRMGLPNRGIIKKGYKADIAVFEPAKVLDKASYTAPCQKSTGMDYVFVNGKLVWKEEKIQQQGFAVILTR